MFYINPNYYGFSSSAKILLTDYVPCNNTIDCYLSTGDYALKTFNFDDVRPYMHISVRIDHCNNYCSLLLILSRYYFL